MRGWRSLTAKRGLHSLFTVSDLLGLNHGQTFLLVIMNDKQVICQYVIDTFHLKGSINYVKIMTIMMGKCRI